MIRDAVPADAPLLESIQHVSLASPWPELLDSGVHGVVDCLVATTETDTSTPVGYALVVDGGEHETEDRSIGSGENTGARAQCYLAELAVDPHYRRSGYGSSLLETVINRTGADELLLTARADDETAKAFYETHGFRVIEQLPEQYEDETGSRDGLLLSKPLDSDSNPDPDPNSTR